ncbi:MAG TPA: T9SS type A sorting domain-containing protein [bacterium]
MKKYVIIGISTIIAFLMLASTRFPTSPGRPFQIKVHNINQVELSISNFGKFGQTQGGGSGLWWPKGSGHNYIFGAGFWYGTVDSASGDTLVTVGYSPHGGECELGPGLEGMPTNDTNAIIFMYPSPWPPPQGVFSMAPQTALSHQDSWCCFNDCDSTWHVPGDTRPIGIEVYQTVYVWNLPAIEDIAFMTYEFKNVSGHNLHDCYFGVVTDCDIGNESGSAANDRISGIIEKHYFIDGLWYIADNLGYQWQEEPESGWSEFPGVIGFDLLQTPFDLVPGQDKDSDGILDQYEQDSAYYVVNLPPYMWDVDLDNTPDWRDPSENPQQGMTAYKRFTLSFEPNTDPQRYLTLAGYNYQNGAYEPYDTMPFAPDDQRFLMSSGPFDLETDESVTMVFAIVLANWHDIYGTPDTALVLADYWAQHVYDHSWRIFDIEERTASNSMNNGFRIFPNPTNTSSTVRFTLAQPGLATLKLYNTAGQLVRMIDAGQRQAGVHDIRLDLNDLSAGTYFIALQTPSTKQVQPIIVLK